MLTISALAALAAVPLGYGHFFFRIQTNQQQDRKTLLSGQHPYLVFRIFQVQILTSRPAIVPKVFGSL
jgi:hypothetical protein